MCFPDYEFEDLLDVKDEYNNMSNVNHVTNGIPQAYEEPLLSATDYQPTYTLTNLTSRENLEFNAQSQTISTTDISFSESPSSEHQISLDVLEHKENHTINIGANYEEITPKFSIPQSSIDTGTLDVLIL